MTKEHKDMISNLLSKSKTDYYSILDVKKDATDDEIKRAYRKKSLQFHPDKNKEEGASECFTRIGEANSVLSDKQKRSVFDSTSSESRYKRPNRQTYNYTESEESMDDLLAELFRNKFQGTMFRQSGFRRGFRFESDSFRRQNMNFQDLTTNQKIGLALVLFVVILLDLYLR